MPSLAVPSRTRSEVRRVRWLTMGVGVAWLALLLAQIGMRPDRGEISPLYVYGLPALLYVSGMISLGLAVSRGRSGAGPRARPVRLAVLVLPALFMLSTLWIEVGPHSMIPADVRSAWMANAACGMMTLVLGTVPLALAAFALRFAFPVRAGWRGALVGLCSGLAAAATIHLHCSVTTTSHILLAHGGPVLILTALGAILGQRFLRT